MRIVSFWVVTLALFGVASAVCLAAASAPADKPAAASAASPVAGNPFAEQSKLPFRLPPFKSIHDKDYEPAFTAGMAQQLREVKAIAINPAPATFDNTILALERSGTMLSRVSKVFFNLSGSDTNPTMEKVEQDVTPKLAAHNDAIQLDPALFARVNTLYQRRVELNLDPESLQLLERDYIGMVRGGAKLSEADKVSFRQMNEKLASLSTQFRLNVLKATADGAVAVDSEQELDGLSAAQISAAAAAAKTKGLDGKFLLTLQNTTVQPWLSSLKNRALRERVYRASIARDTSGPTDNRAIVAEVIRLRAERAKLLGYPNHAAYVLEDNTATTTAAVNRVLGDLAPMTVAAAKREAAEIQKVIDAQAAAAHTPTFQVQPWDWEFYAEQVRKAHYSFDEAAVKPYFELDHVLKDGVFYAAHELYGVTFKERKDLAAYRSDVRIYEVRDADGSALGLFLADYYARDN